MKRYGSVVRLRAEKRDDYVRLHADPWPEIVATIRDCNISNFSIYHKDGWLFSYFEYLGDDLAADMKKMAADAKTQEWWALCMPCQEPLATRSDGEWWAEMDEVFHTD